MPDYLWEVDGGSKKESSQFIQIRFRLNESFSKSGGNGFLRWDFFQFGPNNP